MKILIAEDDTVSRLVLDATLKNLGHDVTAVCDGREAWEALERENFPLLISDWMMPGLDGLELCRLVRAQNYAQYTYIILLTAMGGKTSYLDGMDAGADDFVTKPFDEEQLAARLRVAERILVLHEKLQAQATIDGLTGLLNRTTIVESLTHELDRAGRDGTALGVVLLDLDHFKRVNDTCGHAAGDAVLRTTAQRLKSSMRCYDRVGRFGGEEFLIVAPDCPEGSILALSEKVRQCISEEPVPTPAGQLPVTCSLGAAVSSSDARETGEALLARADAALYRAKEGGRDRIELAAAAMTS